MGKEIFSETQKIQRVWFWVIGIDLIVVGTILTVVLSKSTHKLLEILPPIAIVIVAFSFVIWIFTSSKLIVVVDTEGIKYRYPVFKPKWKKIAKQDIHSYILKNYDAIFDYGGWGVKKSKKNGTCVTIQGNTGLLVELKNGEKILIGTQNKEGIEWAMKRLIQGPSEL
jgi:hypothetical protein